MGPESGKEATTPTPKAGAAFPHGGKRLTEARDYDHLNHLVDTGSS